MEPSNGYAPSSTLWQSVILLLNYLGIVELMKGLEPSLPVWKTGALPLMQHQHMAPLPGIEPGSEA